MILTVTFNPTTDKTAEVDGLIPGGLNRLCNVVQDARGKGINVFKTIYALQGKGVAIGFLAGSANEYVQKVLNEFVIDSDFIWAEGVTRTDLKVLDYETELTELNEAGPVITEMEIKQLKDKTLSLLHPGDFVVLSGNVSAQIRKDIYRELIEPAEQQGARVILDADGELFAQGIQAKPYVIKSNKYEFMTYSGVSQDRSNEGMISFAKTLLNEECRLVAVPMGKQDSIFLSHGEVHQAEVLHTQTHPSIDTGDVMVVAIAYVLEQDTPVEQLIVPTVACNTEVAMTKGAQPAEKTVVEKLTKQVTIKKLGEN